MRALEAFEATSRHLSMTKAADELGVTQAAISHHVRYLSEEIGEPLLTRSGRGINLSPVGLQIARRIQAAFAEIDRSIGEATGNEISSIRLALCSAFGPGWLIRRLSGFYAQHKDINLQLLLYARPPDLTDIVADAFVTPDGWMAGYWGMALQPEQLVAVYGGSRDGSGRNGPRIIKLNTDYRENDDWTMYCSRTGDNVAHLSRNGSLSASHYFLAYEMAKAGAGIALVPEFLVEADLRAGDLWRLSDVRIPTGRTYHLCVRDARREEPALKVLIKWMKQHACAYA